MEMALAVNSSRKDQLVLQSVRDATQRMKKQPIVCGDCAGPRRIKVTLGICTAPNFWTTDIVEWITVMADSDNGFLFLAALWWIWRQRNCFVLGELYKGDVWLLRNIYCAATDFHLAWNRSSSVANVHVEFSWQ
uniref:Uncharacterized protein n=1 Tax=Populus trichocarpa TaxID=3694 RepID=B9GWN5_POPTR